MVIDKEVRNHRDGTSTTRYKQEVPLTEISRRVAVCEKLIGNGENLPSSFSIKLRHEKHGSRVYTYLTLIGPTNLPNYEIGEWIFTKTEVGNKIGAYIETLDNISTLWSEEVFPDEPEDTEAESDENDTAQTGENAIRDLVIEIMFPHDDGNGMVDVMGPSTEQLQRLYDLAVKDDEFELIAALDNRDERRVTEALRDYLRRQGFKAPITDYPDMMTIFVNGKNDDFNPAGIEIRDTGISEGDGGDGVGVINIPSVNGGRPVSIPAFAVNDAVAAQAAVDAVSVAKQFKRLSKTRRNADGSANVETYKRMLGILGVIPKNGVIGDVDCMRAIDSLVDDDEQIRGLEAERIAHRIMDADAAKLMED